MTSGRNNFNGFPETVPTTEITTKIEKILLFSRPRPTWTYFLNGRNAAASVATTLCRQKSQPAIQEHATSHYISESARVGETVDQTSTDISIQQQQPNLARLYMPYNTAPATCNRYRMTPPPPPPPPPHKALISSRSH